MNSLNYVNLIEQNNFTPMNLNSFGVPNASQNSIFSTGMMSSPMNNMYSMNMSMPMPMNTGFLTNLFMMINNFLARLMGNFNGTFKRTWNGTKKFANKTWNGTKQVAVGTWNGIKGGINSVVDFAKSHVGMRNDGRFSQGRNEAWCADFVNYSFEKSTGGVPWGYRDGSGNYKASVSELRNWGQTKGVYSTIERSRSNGFGDIKKGDVIIFKRNGRSHTGLIDKIGKDGTIYTVEGNSSNKVSQRSYNPYNSTIDGFVKVSEYVGNRQSSAIG